MSKKKKNIRKVNKLTLKECEDLLAKLSKDKESHYYNHILEQYRRLMPSMSSAVALVLIVTGKQIGRASCRERVYVLV